MANTSVVTDIANALMRNEEYVGSRITAPDTSPEMALFRKARPVPVKGRGLVYYLNATVRGRGAARYIAENGDLPGGGRAKTQQVYVTPRLGALAVPFSDHEIQAMRGKSKKANALTVATALRDEVKQQRERILTDFFGRDDGVKGRVSGAVTASTTIPIGPEPPLLVVGDQIFSYPDSAGDGRNFGGTEEIGAATVRFVEDIEYDYGAHAGRIIIDTADSLTDNAILDVAYQHGTAGGAAGAPVGFPMGLRMHFNSVLVAAFQHDADDHATYKWGKNTDTTYSAGAEVYANAVRATNSKLNSGLIDAAGALLSLNLLSRAAAKSLVKAGQGKAGKLVVLMNPRAYDRFLVGQEGKTPPAEKVKINGVDFELPVLTIGGARRMPVITSNYWQDGMSVVFPSDILVKVMAEVGWDEGGLKRQTAATGTGYAASWVGYWSYWLDTVADLPDQATIIYNLATADA